MAYYHPLNYWSRRRLASLYARQYCQIGMFAGHGWLRRRLLHDDLFRAHLRMTRPLAPCSRLYRA